MVVLKEGTKLFMQFWILSHNHIKAITTIDGCNEDFRNTSSSVTPTYQ